MATVTKAAVAGFTTDAHFRDWVQKIHDSLSTLGLVQTSDTGQIDPATVAKPGAVDTVAGYEIWRFADALQADFPVFIKLEYGTGSASSGNSPSLWLTVGNSTDGAGSIDSFNRTTRQRNSTSNAGVQSSPAYVSGDSGRVALMWGWASGGVNGGILQFCVERFHDVNGDPTADGVYAGIFNGSGSWNNQSLRSGGIAPGAVETFAMALTPTTGSSGTLGSDTGVYPWHPILGLVYLPILGFISIGRNDIAVDTQFTVSRFGTNRNYRTPAYGGSQGGNAFRASQSGSGPSCIPAILWE